MKPGDLVRVKRGGPWLLPTPFTAGNDDASTVVLEVGELGIYLDSAIGINGHEFAKLVTRFGLGWSAMNYLEVIS